MLGGYAVRGALALVAILLSPLTALACPNCYASSDIHVLHTYYFSAFMLTLLPFAIIGVIFRVGKSLRRRVPPCDGQPVEPTVVG